MVLLFGVALETVSIPALLHFQGVRMLLGGDGPGYDRLARSLLDNGNFSDDGGLSVSRSIGYPIFLAIVYASSQGSYFVLRAVQTLLVILGSWALYRVAESLFDRRIAILAGVFCTSYLPFVFVANHHLTEALSVFLSVFMVLILTHLARDRDVNPGYALALGVLTGFSAQVRPVFALLPVVFALVILFPRLRGDWRSRLLTVTLMAVGYAACVVPTTVRNALITHRFIPFSIGGSGMSLFVSAQQYSGQISYRLTVEEFRAIRAEGDRRLAVAQRLMETRVDRGAIDPAVDTAFLINERYIQDAGTLARAIDLKRLPTNMAERLLYFWSTGDMSPWNNLYVHRIVQVQHAILAVLGAAGMWISRHRLLLHWPLWVFPVYLMVIHGIFHTEPRYSFPARPFLLVYAAVSAASLWDWFRGSSKTREE